MRNSDVIILAARRTPLGSFKGQFASLSAPFLGSQAIRAVVEAAGVNRAALDEVLMGCVLQAGLGQAPARQAARLAGIPDSVGCTTINKVCGSGMKAIMLGCDMIRAGTAKYVLCGGMESMSNAPYLLQGARSGYDVGHQRLLDHMIYDGLQNVDDGEVMGHFAERCVDHYGFSRRDQDTHAAESLRRAQSAIEDGSFEDEIVPVVVSNKKESHTITRDEQPLRCKSERIPQLRPAFRSVGGTVTAATAAAISDGAAAVLLTRADTTRKLNTQPLARIVAHASYAGPPEDFTVAPGAAIERLFEVAGWSDGSVDLYEINEAFAVVVMAAVHDLKLDWAKVNVNGGACALGHPIGATGARLVVSLIHALRHRRLKRGVAALCIGGGEATAMAVEIV